MNQKIFASTSDNFTFGDWTYFIASTGSIWKRKNGTIDAHFLGTLTMPIMLSQIAKIINKDQPGANVDFTWLGAD